MRFLRPAVFVLCLVPLAWMLYAAIAGNLGPDPAEVLMHSTGEWALRLLALTLLLSPLRKWTGWQVVLKLRRMLGLFAFFYGCIHLLAFLQFYIGWLPAAMGEELLERPYIAVGFASLVLMLPLALTSTRKMQRKLGRSWRRLHQLVYPAAVLACIHLLWQARSDLGEALIYIVLFGLLLGWRIRRHLSGRGAVASS